ncbi:MAG: Rrf2 family transcriptional regulator, partial [Planctomycetota bacterium]
MTSDFAIALHILGFLTSRDGGPLTSEEMARTYDTNAVVIRRVQSKLRKAGLIETRRGVNGGSILARKPEDIDLREAYAAVSPEPADEPDETDDDEEIDNRALQLAIVGRPNVGKSTLVNAVVGSDRLLTGPEAGITRDAIAVEWEFDGQRIALVETAGMRRRARVDGKLEKLSVGNSLNAIQYAHVAVL